MNMETILKKTVSYEDWIVETLQGKQEVELYIEACLDVFREDGDLDGLLSALELALRAQNRDKLHPLPRIVGLSFPYPPLADVPFSDDLPTIQLDGWPATIPAEPMSHPHQPDPVASYPHYLPSTSPESGEEEWDNLDATTPKVHYLYPETLLGANTWGTSMPKKDRTLER